MEDDRFLSKLLSRDASANSSSRIFYYGRNTGAVPFLWESRPGTPKHHRHCPDNPLPPLTPPPSYFMSPGSRLLVTPDWNSNLKKQPKMLGALLSKLSLSSPRKPHYVSPASSSGSTSSSSSSSSSWSLGSRGRKQSRVKLSSLEFEYHEEGLTDFNRHPDVQDEECVSSPRSVMGFGNARKSKSGTRLFRGCYPVPSMKNKLLSIVGHGTSQG